MGDTDGCRRRALILDGSAAGDALAPEALGALRAELGKRGHESEVVTLCEMDIAPCLGCFGCWVRSPGECVIDDDARGVVRKIVQSDVLVLLTPVTFGGYSSELKKALDRWICVISPFFTKIDGEVHHRRRYERYPRILGVGLLPTRDAEAEEIFSTLVTRNALNIHSPPHTTVFLYRDRDADARNEDIRDALDRLAATS